MTERSLVGPSLAAFITALAVRHHQSRRRIREFLLTWFGVALAVGTLDRCLREVGVACEPIVEDLLDGLIGRARAEAPRASIAETANLLIAAYCPVVAQMTTRSTQEKWQLMRQFDRVLMQQLSATAMPQGSLIVVNVPLAPAIYETLSIQAKASGQQTTDFIAGVLARAARQ